jgi:trigger factor
MSMILHTLKKLPKNTYEILVIIPKDEIAKEYEKAFMKLQDNLTVEGFRKGKAPREIAEKNLPRQDVYQQVIQDLLPEVYAEIVKKENITPVVSPKVDLVKAKEGEDWELKMEVAEKPSIDLSNYKEIVRKAKQDAKKPEIWTPGSAPKAENPEEKKQDNLNEVLSALLKDVKIEISELIIEQELNHRLTKLVDDIQKIGLTKRKANPNVSESSRYLDNRALLMEMGRQFF